MRVLLANKYYARRGGAESVVLQTQRLLEQAGHEVVPFAMRDDGNEPTPWSEYFVPARQYFEGSIVRRVGDSLATIYSFETRRKLRELLRVARPEIAHLHNVYHQLSLSMVDELRAARIPIVMTLHDYKPACPNYLFLANDGPCQRCVGGGYWNAIRHRCLKGSIAGSSIAAAEAYLNRFRGQYEKIDLFLAPSEFLQDAMVRAGLPRERIEVLRNAVAAEPQQRVVPARPKFVYSGRLAREKGVEWILDASPSISPDVEVTLLGSGPLEARLRDRVAREGLAVDLKGFVQRDVLARELNTTTAALLPSACYENCPMSILEAGALGIPSIASDIGGIRELITSGSDGILIPLGDTASLADAVNMLAERPDLVASLGDAARRRVVREHSEQGFGEALLSHYDRALRRHGRNGRQP